MKKTLYDRYPRTADKGIKGVIWLLPVSEDSFHIILIN